MQIDDAGFGFGVAMFEESGLQFVALQGGESEVLAIADLSDDKRSCVT
jgi:hypothetical protein